MIVDKSFPDDANTPEDLLMVILEARKTMPLPTWPDEEEVNVYLAGVLNRLINPLGQPLEFKYNHELATELEGKDKAAHYRRFKRNADAALVLLGVFRSLPPTGAPFTRSYFIGQGCSDYAQAASFRHQIDRHASTLVQVLCRMSDGFEEYLDLFEHIRRDYFNLRVRLSEGTLYHLRREHDIEE